MRCAGQGWEPVSLCITPDTAAKWGPRRGTSHRGREMDQKTISTSLAGDPECVERGQGPACRLWRNILTTLWGLGKGRAERKRTAPVQRKPGDIFPYSLPLPPSLSLSLLTFQPFYSPPFFLSLLTLSLFLINPLFLSAFLPFSHLISPISLSFQTLKNSWEADVWWPIARFLFIQK